jgi:hypothetical protein
MKTRRYCLAAVLGSVVLVLVGCGNNSTDQSNSTNSVSGTQSPANNTDTNLPSATNPPAAH